MDSIDWIIINKSLDGSLDDQESKMLSDWLAESAEHRALYRKIDRKSVGRERVC